MQTNNIHQSILVLAEQNNLIEDSKEEQESQQEDLILELITKTEVNVDQDLNSIISNNNNITTTTKRRKKTM